MEMFDRKKKKKKKWVLELVKCKGSKNVRLSAVDKQRGDELTTFITFSFDGRVEIQNYAFKILGNKGYDPNQHGNVFDEFGKLIIK